MSGSYEVEIEDDWRTSPVVQALELAWDCIRATDPLVPAAQPLLWPSTAIAVKCHFVERQWSSLDGERHVAEVRVSAEALKQGGEFIFMHLLDQAAVSRVRQLRKGNLSNLDRYRSGKQYRPIAEALGLLVDDTGLPHGWLPSGLHQRARDLYSNVIDGLDSAITAYRLEHLDSDGEEDEGEDSDTGAEDDSSLESNDPSSSGGSDGASDDDSGADERPEQKRAAHPTGGRLRPKRWTGCGPESENRLVTLRHECPEGDDFAEAISQDIPRWLVTKSGELGRGNIVCGFCYLPFYFSTSDSRPVFLEDQGFTEWEERLRKGRWSDDGRWKKYREKYKHLQSPKRHSWGAPKR